MLSQEICIDHSNDFYTESELASSFSSLPPSIYSPSSWFSEFDFEEMEEQEAEFGVYTAMKHKNDNRFEITEHVEPGRVSVPAELLISEYLKSNPSHPEYSRLTNCFSPTQPSTSSMPPSSKSIECAMDKRMKCTICGQIAHGFHFNALSCAACGAFFRRSIADQKTYSCSTKDCDISQPRKHGTTCRYCRFQACILNGMLPNEVQCKRRKVQTQTSCSPPSSHSSSSSSFSFFPTFSLPIPTSKPATAASSPEYHYKSDQSVSNCTTKKRKLQPVAQTSKSKNDQLENTTSLLEAICTARRKIVGMRAGNSRQNHMFSTNYNNSKQFFEEEMHWFQTIVLEDPLIHKIFADNCQENQFDEAEKASNWNFCFWMWCLLESALATLRYGGVQTGRIYFPGQGFLELQHEDFVEFFYAKFSRDASSLARLSLPIAEFFVENLCRSLQAERLGGEYECAALLALVLSGVISEQGGSTHSQNHASSSTRSMNVKRQIFSELLDHYTCSSSTCNNTCNSPAISNTPTFFNGDSQMPASKMGIVLLASSSLIEVVNMLKELYCCLKIVEDLD